VRNRKPLFVNAHRQQDFVKQMLMNQHENNKKKRLLQLFPPNYGLHKIRNVKQNSSSPVFKPFSFFCSFLRRNYGRFLVPTHGLLFELLMVYRWTFRHSTLKVKHVVHTTLKRSAFSSGVHCWVSCDSCTA
jgi:hypothetical protein